MEDNKIRERLIKKILESIPSNIKSTNYLMDILELGRESVYRRLKGDIVFTLDEIITLSVNLGFSIDEIVAESENDRAIFGLPKYKPASSENSLLQAYDLFQNVFFDLYKSQNGSITMILNRITSLFLMDKDMLFRFFYYKWIHQFEKVPLNYSLSEVKIPEEIKSICKKIQYYAKHIDSTLIFDPDIFHNTFKEIKYYYERKLVSDFELQIMKNEVAATLKEMQITMQNGVNEINTKSFYYISSLPIENNSSYINMGDSSIIYIDIYGENGIYTNDSQFCHLYKQRINSIKKFSTLISESNEKMQAEFFSQQYEYLEKL